MGERRGRPYVPDLNQLALPDLNYSPPPSYSYEEELEQPPFLAQHVWNVEVIAAATEGEGSTDTTAASKPKTVQEANTENSTYWSTIKKVLKRTLSKLPTVTKDAPAE